MCAGADMVVTDLFCAAVSAPAFLFPGNRTLQAEPKIRKFEITKIISTLRVAIGAKDTHTAQKS